MAKPSTKKPSTKRTRKPAAAKETPPVARDESLEAAIQRDPSAPMAYLVYGDWLQQKGDPRGELVALQAALVDAPANEFVRLKMAEEELLAAHPVHFYGPLARFPAARRTHLEWSMGFVEEICEGANFEPELFRSHPSARFVRTVAGGPLSAPPPCLRRFTAQQSDLAWVWSAPGLEELRVGFGPNVDIAQPRHERLTRLEVNDSSSRLLQALAHAELPSLRELRLLRVEPSGVPLLDSVLARFPDVRFDLGLRGEAGGSFAALRTVAPRVKELCLDGVEGDPLDSLRAVRFENAVTLRIAAGPDSDERNLYFELLPELPAVREVILRHPPDLVRYFRSFANSALARGIERLSVKITRPAAGRALVERSYEKVTELAMQWEPTLSPEYLESARTLAADAFPRVLDLRFGPAKHLDALASSPMGPRLRSLTIALENEYDAVFWLKHRDRFCNLVSVTIGGNRLLSRPTLERLFDHDVKIVWARKSPRMDR